MDNNHEDKFKHRIGIGPGNDGLGLGLVCETETTSEVLHQHSVDIYVSSDKPPECSY